MEDTMTEELVLYTTKELCNILHVSSQTLRNWRKERKLRVVKINNRVLYSKKDIDELIIKYTKL